MENQDNSFWRSNIKSVPGRPSPKKEIPKPGSSSSTSFERYQKSVSDAWTLSEDELTKEYCILSEEPKMSRRAGKPPKGMTIGVHRHQTSSSAPTSSLTSISSVNNSATVKNTATSNNNNSADTSRDENENQPQRKVSETQSEKSIEYG
jgi:TBC1 domain family member 2